MALGIIANGDRDIDFAFSKKAAALIHACGEKAIVDCSFADTSLGRDENITIASYEDCSLIFCIGGDGTLLAAVHDHYTKEIPFIGVNLGSIGFLTEIQPDQFPEALQRIISGDYEVEKRIQLYVSHFDKNRRLKSEGVCMNDVAVARGAQLNIFSTDMFVDGDHVERLSGDGIVISTPTGSTAYSLAAGGPIVKPELDLFLLTPICPHTLHNRSYVVKDTSIVELRLADFAHAPVLALDGRKYSDIDPYDRVVVKKAESPMTIACLGYQNFYQTIRQKIHARGSFYEDEQK